VSGELQRASDTERERAVVRLREASTEGRLTLEELADRTGLAYRAQSHADLELVTADLPVAHAVTAQPRRRWVVGAFAPVTRRGRWQLGGHTIVVAAFAPVKLDLGDATAPAGEATVTIVSLFAPVFVTVPEQVDLDLGVVALLAPVHEEHPAASPPPGAPCVRVNGIALMAPVFARRRRS
jgi:hypothetical protein